MSSCVAMLDWAQSPAQSHPGPGPATGRARRDVGERKGCLQASRRGARQTVASRQAATHSVATRMGPESLALSATSAHTGEEEDGPRASKQTGGGSRAGDSMVNRTAGGPAAAWCSARRSSHRPGKPTTGPASQQQAWLTW